MALSAKQKQAAKNYASAKMGEGFTVQAFCSDNSISTRTWYDWLEEDGFISHLSKVQNELIPEDEKQAYEAMKKHILRLAYKTNPSPKEVELFMDTFSYLAEADKQKHQVAQKLASSDTRSFEEKKASLLLRLTS